MSIALLINDVNEVEDTIFISSVGSVHKHATITCTGIIFRIMNTHLGEVTVRSLVQSKEVFPLSEVVNVEYGHTGG